MLGDTLFFHIHFSSVQEMTDSVRVYHNGRHLFTAYEQHDTSHYVLPQQVGKQTVRLVAYLDGREQTRTVTTRFYSDIVPETYSYTIVNQYPHDLKAFTQGLLYHDGYLYESTGQWGQSSLRKVDHISGEVLQQIELSDDYFAEGLTRFGDQLIQLTYKAGKAFVYDLETFEQVHSFYYANAEGWGITTYHDQFIMTDGSHVLFFWNQHDFVPTDEVEVYDHQGPVYRLNELEYSNGKLWANVFMEDYIVLIDPQSGRVEARVDFSHLLDPGDKHAHIDVLNGIAVDDETGHLYITGKNWPALFEVALERQEAPLP